MSVREDAPAPSPPADIAGLVERAMSNPPLLDYIPLLRDLASALTRIAQGRESKQVHIEVLQEVLAAAEARLSSARDEGLEMAAKLIDAEADEAAYVYITEVAAAIRALKATS